jgi:hypothetical protein
MEHFDAATVSALVADKLLDIDLSLVTRRVLVVSTAMVPEHTAKHLDENGILPLTVHDMGNGWHFWILGPEEFDESTRAQHPELMALCKFARDRNYDLLWLDSDEYNLPPECGLPVFDW